MLLTLNTSKQWPRLDISVYYRKVDSLPGLESIFKSQQQALFGASRRITASTQDYPLRLTPCQLHRWPTRLLLCLQRSAVTFIQVWLLLLNSLYCMIWLPGGGCAVPCQARLSQESVRCHKRHSYLGIWWAGTGQIRLRSWKLFCVFCIYYVHIIVLYTVTISIYIVTCSPKVFFEDDIALGGIC